MTFQTADFFKNSIFNVVIFFSAPRLFTTTKTAWMKQMQKKKMTGMKRRGLTVLFLPLALQALGFFFPLKRLWYLERKNGNIKIKIHSVMGWVMVECDPRLMEGFLISPCVFTSVGVKCSYWPRLNYEKAGWIISTKTPREELDRSVTWQFSFLIFVFSQKHEKTVTHVASNDLGLCARGSSSGCVFARYVWRRTERQRREQKYLQDESPRSWAGRTPEQMVRDETQSRGVC